MSFELVAPRVDFLDPRTGKISREWYSFFRTLFRRVGGSTGTDLEDLINQLPVPAPPVPVGPLQDELWSMPAQVLTVEEEKVLQLEGQISELQSLVAELTKQVQALQLSTTP
jgi:hypothetical protein